MFIDRENKKGYETILGIISKSQRRKVERLVQEFKIPITLIVGIALENELSKPFPFTYDVSFPEGEFEEYTFVEPAGKIISWMKENGGGSLAYLCLLRFDMGVEDKDTFLLAFKEALDKDMIETYKPKQPAHAQVKYDDDFLFYRVKGTGRKAIDKQRKKSSKYEEFIKLRKEFEGK